MGKRAKLSSSGAAAIGLVVALANPKPAVQERSSNKTTSSAALQAALHGPVLGNQGCPSPSLIPLLQTGGSAVGNAVLTGSELAAHLGVAPSLDPFYPYDFVCSVSERFNDVQHALLDAACGKTYIMRKFFVCAFVAEDGQTKLLIRSTVNTGGSDETVAEYSISVRDEGVREGRSEMFCIPRAGTGSICTDSQLLATVKEVLAGGHLVDACYKAFEDWGGRPEYPFVKITRESGIAITVLLAQTPIDAQRHYVALGNRGNDKNAGTVRFIELPSTAARAQEAYKKRDAAGATQPPGVGAAEAAPHTTIIIFFYSAHSLHKLIIYNIY